MDDIVARIDARKITLADRVPRVMAEIENAFEPQKQKFIRELNAIMSENG